MNAVIIGKANLRECPRCEGIWADAASLEQICEDRERQGAVLGMATTLSTPESVEIEQNIRYLPCPVCSALMNRVNFAHCSKVIIDVCKQHGSWFDKDELRRIVEFIRAGGMEESRARETEELEHRRRELAAAKTATGYWPAPTDPPQSNYPLWEISLSAAATFLKSLLR